MFSAEAAPDKDSNSEVIQVYCHSAPGNALPLIFNFDIPQKYGEVGRSESARQMLSARWVMA